ncbi:MAG: alpha/beta fold hydrolase [Archangium sp.]|nr:alpha/beta fold hydrolase [Archangium sp.]
MLPFSRRGVLLSALPVPRRHTFVLVPGAWHGAWAWRAVEANLRARGHAVFAVTLTGVAERAHLASNSVTLSTHVTDVARTLEVEGLHDVTLVGHSYGGMVVLPVAARLAKRVRCVVALDAFLPRSGESMFQLMKPSYVESWRAKAAASGGITVPPMLDARAMGVPATDAGRVDELLTPHPLQTFETSVAFDDTALLHLERRYLRCGRYPGFAPWAKRAEADGWRVDTIDAGHDAMLAAPDALATLLLS